MSRRLGHIAEIIVSTVDKKTCRDEEPVRLCNYVDVYKNHDIDDTLEYMPATANPEEVERFSLKPGDTVFTKDSETADDIGVPAFVRPTAKALVCGYHLAIARPRTSDVLPRYLYWALASEYVAQRWATVATGVTHVGLRRSDVRKLPITVPSSLDGQQEIADYLDRKTAKIDALIAKQEELVTTLQEHRSAVATQAFRALANSPSTRLKFEAQIQTGVTLGPTEPTMELVVAVPYLRVANVQDGRLDLSEIKKILLHNDEVPRYLLRAGDVLMTEGGDLDKLGRGAIWRGEINCCVHQNHIFAVRCGRRLLNRYLTQAMTSDVGRAYFASTAKKTTNLASTNSTTLGNFAFPLPTVPMQEATCTEIEKTTTRLDSLVEKAQGLIEIMRERRSALISAALAGQLDIDAYAC